METNQNPENEKKRDTAIPENIETVTPETEKVTPETNVSHEDNKKEDSQSPDSKKADD